jgi:hypothetical protein
MSLESLPPPLLRSLHVPPGETPPPFPSLYAPAPHAFRGRGVPHGLSTPPRHTRFIHLHTHSVRTSCASRSSEMMPRHASTPAINRDPYQPQSTFSLSLLSRARMTNQLHIRVVDDSLQARQHAGGVVKDDRLPAEVDQAGYVLRAGCVDKRRTCGTGGWAGPEALLHCVDCVVFHGVKVHEKG